MADIVDMNAPRKEPNKDERDIAKLQHLIDSATEPTAMVLNMTPAMAKSRTSSGVHQMKNRKLRGTKITRFARAMKERGWVLNGETVVFEGGKAMDGLGRLANGYHRFAACIRANKSFTTFVVFGVESAAFRMLDTGTVRNLADAFQVEDIPNSSVVPYAARWIKILTSADPYDRGLKIENHEALAFYRTLDTVRLHQLVPDAKRISKRSKHLLPPPQVLAFLYLAKPNVARRAVALLTAPNRSTASALHEFMQTYRESNVRIDENVRTIALQVTFDAIRRGDGRLSQRTIKDAVVEYRLSHEAKPRR